MTANNVHVSIAGILPVPDPGSDARDTSLFSGRRHGDHRQSLPETSQNAVVRLNTYTHGPSLAACCLTCLFLCLLITPVIADPASTPTDANNQDSNKPNGADWLIAKTPKTDLSRNIWRDRIGVPQNPEENKTKDQLQQLIKRIRAIEFKPPEPVHEPAVTREPEPQIEPNLIKVGPPDENLIDARQTATSPLKPQHATVAQDTLSILAERLQKPELLNNPYELGETLSNAGCLKEAAVCYRQALARIDPNLPDPTEKKAWILFQIGNCLRRDDPQKALEAYSRLINEHPPSLWTDIAKAQSSLINWYLQDKPKTLIEESRPKPPDNAKPLAFISTPESKANTEPQQGE